MACVNTSGLETDGKLMTGYDVAVACLLGAEEFGFATAPLVSMGCMMMRVCNLDTCPVGIATQNEKLRARFKGKPEYVMNFMLFVARELREIMAELGYRSVDEMVGHVEDIQLTNHPRMTFASKDHLHLTMRKDIHLMMCFLGHWTPEN